MSDSLFTTGIRPAFDAWLIAKGQEVREYGNYWSASSAGYCMRRNIFERLKVPYVKEDARKQRVFAVGDVFHKFVQDITKEAGLSIAQELELQDEELMIRGHIDDLALIKNDEYDLEKMDELGVPLNTFKDLGKDHLILYDYKSASSRSFTYSKGKPMSYYHKHQLGTYMMMLRKLMAEEVKPVELADLPELVESRILKISKDDLRMEEHQLLWSEELEKEVVGYWSALNEAWASKKLPPCTCHEHEGGFLAREAYNPWFYEDEPCSLGWYKKCKDEGLVK